MMKEQVEERLRMLHAEFKAGQEIMAELEARQSDVRNTLVRISGAIQVLEELLRPATENESQETVPHPAISEAG